VADNVVRRVLGEAAVRVALRAKREALEDAVACAVQIAINRTYKHRDDRLPDGVADQLVEHAARAFWEALDDRGLEVR
jgi:hypothetical protein